MAAGRLDVLLGLDAAEFTTGLSKAELDAQRFRQNLVRIGGQLGTALGAGFSAAAVGLGILTKQSIDAADHLNDLSKSTGVAVETLGGIGFAASQAGSDLDGVAQSFGKFNLKIAEAARGEKEASEAFKAIGVSVKDAAGKVRAADEIFRDVASAFSSYADGPEKAALGNAIFGKSYQALLPLLADGGKALQENVEYYQRFGGVTTETARAADEFNDTLGKISLVTGQLGRNLATELLPPLQAVADEILKFVEQSNAFDTLAKAARTAFQTIAVLFANVKFVFEGVGREIAAVAAQMTALATLDFSGFKAISDAVKDDGVRARKELDALEKRILGLAAGPSLASRIGTANPDRQLERITRGLPSAPSLSGPPGDRSKAIKPQKETIDENTRAFASYVDELARGLEKEEQLTRAQEIRRKAEQGAFGQLTAQQRELLSFYESQFNALDEFEAKVKANAEAAAAWNRESERLQSVVDQIVKNDDLQRLKDLDFLLEQGRITLEQFNEETRRIAGFDKELDKTGDAARELGLTFTSALEDAIVDFESLRDVVKGLEKDLVRIGTRKLVTEPLGNFFTDLFKGLGGSGGSGIGSFIASLFGGQNLAGVFAGGTDFVQRDGLAMIHRGERIVPAHENRQGAARTNNITVNVQGNATRESANQIAAAVARQLAFADRRYN